MLPKLGRSKLLDSEHRLATYHSYHLSLGFSFFSFLKKSKDKTTKDLLSPYLHQSLWKDPSPSVSLMVVLHLSPCIYSCFSLPLISEMGCQNMTLRAGEIAWQLRSLAALPGHLGLIPSRHMAHVCNSSPRSSNDLFWLLWFHTCTW